MTERLIASDETFPSLRPGSGHLVARSQRPANYPERSAAPSNWSLVDATYDPPQYTDPKVLAQPPWADPESFDEALERRGERGFASYEPPVLEGDRPRNPRGPTGLEGRGLLGNYGANFAADPIVFRLHQGRLQMVAIQRRDNGLWAIPGGMVDAGERVSATLARELAEEALGKEASPGQVAHWEEQFARLFSERGVEVYRGYVDDFRNTDDAWMETSAFYLLLTEADRDRLGWDLNLVAGDDAQDTRWMNVTGVELERMHANHAEIVGRAVQLLEEREGLRIDREGHLSGPLVEGQ